MTQLQRIMCSTHLRRLGPALTTYLWLMTQLDNDDGYGLVAGGEEIPAKRIGTDIDCNQDTVLRHLDRLAMTDYIHMQRGSRGFRIEVVDLAVGESRPNSSPLSQAISVGSAPAKLHESMSREETRLTDDVKEPVNPQESRLTDSLSRQESRLTDSQVGGTSPSSPDPLSSSPYSPSPEERTEPEEEEEEEAHEAASTGAPPVLDWYNWYESQFGPTLGSTALIAIGDLKRRWDLTDELIIAVWQRGREWQRKPPKGRKRVGHPPSWVPAVLAELGAAGVTTVKEWEEYEAETHPTPQESTGDAPAPRQSARAERQAQGMAFLAQLHQQALSKEREKAGD